MFLRTEEVRNVFFPFHVFNMFKDELQSEQEPERRKHLPVAFLLSITISVNDLRRDANLKR